MYLEGMTSMISLVLVFALLAQPAPARLVDAPQGIGVIAWENTTGANSVVVFNIDSDCPYPVVVAIDPARQHVTTQIPEGPPYEGRCLLRSGERLYVQRYKDNFFLDQEGPFVVSWQVWLPEVRR